MSDDGFLEGKMVIDRKSIDAKYGRPGPKEKQHPKKKTWE